MTAPNEKSIFLDALEYDSPNQREAYLLSACGDNPQLRASVDRLLEAHYRDDNPLDSPAVVLSVDRPTDLHDQTLPYSALTDEETPGTTIGAYRLMEQIGEGGFGIVYVAEQQKPIRRRVALKIIKPGMDTREVVARFEAERQALALMDHPNIARVFDGGATPTGRPYFVMELVRGVPITTFCDQHQLDATQRLELFITVCRAVQHAHQKGVIHRDLKPSNILVTLNDGAPLAKVIDFGVAKAIGPSMTDKTIYTRFTALIGTPLYMSPEQAEMTSQDVDTRSDIYSLGVILYELLTGSTPFDGQRFSTVGIDEVRRIIREEQPPLPSARLSTLGDNLPTVSATRGSDPTRLTALVRGDLDWIVMKAIDKDRTRRYETANGLAADINRYLHAEPVEARPPSRAYRLRKFAERNKAVITTAVFVLSVLLLATVVSMWQAIQATRERNKKEVALAQAEEARKEANKALDELAEFNGNLIRANSLLASGDANVMAQQWLAAEDEFNQAVELQPNYYLAWLGRGSFYVRLGLWDEAASDFKQALQLGVEPTGSTWMGVTALFAYLDDWQACNKMQDSYLQMIAANKPVGMSELRACLINPVEQTQAELVLKQTLELAKQRQPGPGRDWMRGEPPVLPEEMFGEGMMGEGLMGFGPGPEPGDRGGPGGPGGPRPAMPGDQFRSFPMPREIADFLVGLAYLRTGDNAQAIEHLRQAQGDVGWGAAGICDPPLAIAYYKSGDREEARAALDRSDRRYQSWVDQMASSDLGQMPIPWFDWVEFVVLRREAHRTVLGQAPAEDQRLEIKARNYMQTGMLEPEF